MRARARRTDTPRRGSPHIAHWDEVEEHDHEEGRIRLAWRYLGEAAGRVGVVNRIGIHPGSQSTPLHSHGEHEEVFFARHQAPGASRGHSWTPRGQTAHGIN